MNGLILCGGRSTRMQQDKSQIDYHGLPQWEYLYRLIQPLTQQVYLSCRKEQHFDTSLSLIVDSIEDVGPATGILSAHAAFPAATFLVLACDLPLISEQSLRYLIAARDVNKEATAFISPFNQSPEPLITIWEPAGMERLKGNAAAGKTCPRKTLMQADIRLIENPFTAEQFNANTPEEMGTAKQLIKNGA